MTRMLPQAGLQAVFDELSRLLTEIRATLHEQCVSVDNSDGVQPRFRVIIRDCQTPTLAEHERDELRRLIREAAFSQGLADCERLSQLAVKNSGRYLVSVADLVGDPPNAAGMEWLMQRYDLD